MKQEASLSEQPRYILITTAIERMERGSKEHGRICIHLETCEELWSEGHFSGAVVQPELRQYAQMTFSPMKDLHR